MWALHSVESPRANITVWFGHFLDARTSVNDQAGLCENGLEEGLGPRSLPLPYDWPLNWAQDVVEDDDE